MTTIRTATLDERDRTTKARIRDAAIARFAGEGIGAANLKDIAADVGVSAPLIIHHFGSKDGLRAACDDYVVAAIREAKHGAVAGSLDPLATLREMGHGPPLVGYLAKTLADGSKHVTGLIDQMVDDAVEYMAEGVQRGMMKPTERPRERVVVVMMWMLGALALHEHVERLLGVDLTSDVTEMVEYMAVAGEILTHGILQDDFHEEWVEAGRRLRTEHH